MRFLPWAVGLTSLAVIIIAVSWRRRSLLYVHLDATMADTRGVVVVVQRHAQAAKNVALKQPKARLLEAARTRPDDAVEAWRKLARDARWFDDGLTAAGRAEARRSGDEITRVLEAAGARAVRRLSSPFRRALETQLEASSSSSSFSSICAHDLLGETPFDEAACERASRDDIRKRYGGRVSVDDVADTYPTRRGDDKISAQLRGDPRLDAVMAARVADFDRSVLRPLVCGLPPRTAVWITTHKGTAAPLVRRLLGRPIDLENGHAICFRLFPRACDPS